MSRFQRKIPLRRKIGFVFALVFAILFIIFLGGLLAWSLYELFIRLS